MTAAERARRGAALRVLASFNIVFVISQFYRSAIAVIAPELSVELGLSPTALGVVAGAFFVAIAAMQLPVGVLLDRYGPRRTTPALLMLAVAGAVLFATAERLPALIAGQALIGAGCAGVFMGGLVAVARWFPAERFAMVAAIMVAISTGGLLLSATPFAWVVEAIGWRSAFLIVAGATLLFGAIIAVVVRDAPPGHDYYEREPERLVDIMAGLRRVLADRDMHAVVAIAFVAYGAVFAVRGLWGGPYLADVHDLEAVTRGNVLLVMSAGTMCGLLLYGPLERRMGARRQLVLAGAGISVVAFALLAGIPRPPVLVAGALLTIVAAAGSYMVLLLAHGRSLFPDELIGRAVTTVNFANFVGVGLLQVGSGLLIGLFPHSNGAVPEAAYRAVFAVLALVLLAAMLVYRRARDPGVRDGVVSRRAD